MFPGDAGAMERDRSPADCKKGSSSITSWSIKCEKQADKKKGGGADNTKGVMGCCQVPGQVEVLMSQRFQM